MSDLSSDLASLKISRDAVPARGGALRVVVILGVLAGLGAAGYVAGVPYLEAKVFRASIEVTEVTLVSPAQASVELTATGYVVPQRISKVGSQLGGRIARVFVHEGSTVRAGDPIAELEDANPRAARAAAQARVATAKARVKSTAASLAEIRQQAKRERGLAAQGIAPLAGAEDLEARALAMAEQVQVAKAEVKAAESEVESLDINLGYTKIVAPMDGTVVGKPIQAGELVGGMQGIALAELVDFSSLLIEADVPEGRLHLLELGTPAEIVLDAFPEKRYRGSVAEISPRVNRAKASVTVKVAFVDDRAGVLPDMAARVSFLSEALDEGSLAEPAKQVVPAAAIADRGGGKVVFVVDEGTVRMMPVQLGPTFGSGFELIDGPPPGTRLVKNPASTLADGQRVKEDQQT